MAEIMNVAEVCEFLRGNDNFILLTHNSPDGDTLGSASALAHALKKMGKKVCIRCGEIIPKKYNYLFEGLEQDSIETGTTVALDVADNKLMPQLWQEFGGKVDLNIDHHISNTRYAERLLLDSDAAAACEIVYEIVKQLGFEKTAEVGAAIYTGISTDTGGFRYSNTTARTHSIAADIMKNGGVDCAEIDRLMFESKTKSQIAVETYVLSRIKYYFDGRCALLSVPRSVRKKFGCKEDEIDAIASAARSIEGVMVGVTLKQKDDGTIKASVRTHHPVDASAICKSLGGGGHVRAAGCSLGNSMPKARRRILKAVKAHLEGNL